MSATTTSTPVSFGAHISLDNQSRIPVQAFSSLPSSQGLGKTLVERSHSKWSDWTYPTGPSRGGVNELVHGVDVNDPWRDLENLESDETQRFIKEQNDVSFARSGVINARR